MVHRYLGPSAVADRIGVKPDTLHRYPLPQPDAEVTIVRKDGSRDTQQAWLPDTIDEWHAQRPTKRPVGPVREHIQKVREGGKPIAQIAAEAGVSRTMVERLLGKNPQKYLLADGIDKLMSVKP
ncbi:hypothetical protein [Nocardia nova]|jgi:hypothetical protein|uniref:hypothetical protein n=1 Tax=Nocardia nova TaxID=37330 RepID=UPI001E4C2C33|nr:hypothetical protein [Nocardia nova]